MAMEFFLIVRCFATMSNNLYAEFALKMPVTCGPSRQGESVYKKDS